MKTTELRLGNFVKDQFGDVIIVDGLDDMDVFSSDCGDIPVHAVQPIPLTEQWLLDFGFEDEGGSDYVLTKGEHTLLITVEIDSIRVYLAHLYGTYDSEYTYLKDILCVHHLQNLYFALFQEDLILKEKTL